jgi:hypothetical protein
MANGNGKDSGNPFEMFNAQQNGELRKFSDELLNKFRGKILEIYIGDQCETMNYDEVSVPKNCSIFGKLVDVLDRMVVLDCYYIDSASKQVVSGNITYINSFQIRAMTEVDGKGSLGDIFLSVNAASKIRKMIKSGQVK